MSRQICLKCQYPMIACLCESINVINITNEVIVLQDPNEVKHAKNTVKLLSLVIPQVKIVVGETPDDFASLISFLTHTQKAIYVIYPAKESACMDDIKPDKDAILLFLDGTWRKVFKMMSLNPWLNDFPALHLNLDAPSQYNIRKAPREDSLSTLEAVALSLQAIDKQNNINPLHQALNAMVDKQLQFMPEKARKRYDK
ncbi:tRNA-uridine aminocarboxypropyltransferase [Shewanella surugensis]|uniref:tRNA-uridine aminocarboxypropyltransferase n=1 Tax=Shewanella surugensis TaxID=212020 RepID=A0ABT0LBY3_9GAMM|nr:tRNA-uridine aminocarboxypropyltransferase [Shewanella surugensis]MCL1125150.1 DTW domain-containing protein [Shewanella surugensis]